MLMTGGHPVSGLHFLCITLDGHVLSTNHFSFKFLAASYAPMGRRMAQRDDRVGRRQGLDDPVNKCCVKECHASYL